MDRSEIFDKIAEVAADVLGVDVAEISDETTFDDLDANSLERLQLVTAIEDEFNLEIDDETLLSLNSVADAVDAIENARRPRSWLCLNDLRVPRKFWATSSIIRCFCARRLRILGSRGPAGFCQL